LRMGEEKLLKLQVVNCEAILVAGGQLYNWMLASNYSLCSWVLGDSFYSWMMVGSLRVVGSLYSCGGVISLYSCITCHWSSFVNLNC